MKVILIVHDRALENTHASKFAWLKSGHLNSIITILFNAQFYFGDLRYFTFMCYLKNNQ